MIWWAGLQGRASRDMGAVRGAAIRLSTLLAGLASGGQAVVGAGDAKDGESRRGSRWEEEGWHWAGKESERGWRCGSQVCVLVTSTDDGPDR